MSGGGGDGKGDGRPYVAGDVQGDRGARSEEDGPCAGRSGAEGEDPGGRGPTRVRVYEDKGPGGRGPRRTRV